MLSDGSWAPAALFNLQAVEFWHIGYIFMVCFYFGLLSTHNFGNSVMAYSGKIWEIIVDFVT